ncbi:MAG: cytochrome C biogenesis protein [Gemmatimonas sp.]|uniref:heme lyase CcmF/NrfE family subunit n=1 Tax=Gemmatimonas sp. UBA7669 TaxID=1946568 RepID=UPI0025C5D229|nr:heme lyase CcmF/NrfE family subunit [Gemmatimonas sp. UBA7669]MBA3917869.1 cytochrome C biogenesis protein [Gemmatimonas sp.]
MILVGELSLWVALLMAAWTTTVSFSGGLQGRADLVKSGERAMYATFFFTLLASIGLWVALFTHDFSIKFVASYTSANLPKVYTFTAFWAGQAGSMLFWVLILTLYSAIAVFANRQSNRGMMPYVTGTLGVVSLFFLMTTAFGANPYERLDWVPIDGRGMNPQLQNPGMAAHPPMLYLGYIATSVPFAFAVGALITRQLDAQWLGAVRRWALVSWFFLTIGIVLGMWWAYVELGWSGYWAWDAVENSSFLPWLTVTAFLHSIMIQEKRGMLRKWNVTLVVLSFLLTILGTFITRSGIIESVHAFAQSNVGNWFLGFLIAATALTAWLVSTRLNDLQAKAELESMVSREAAFLYNNLVLIGICFATLWGTIFPILSEWVKGDKITVGPPFFNSVNAPLGLLLLALTGIGPLIAWRKASVSNLQRQFTWPVIAGVATLVALLALGMRDPYALVSYLLAGFVIGTIVQEFAKGIGARRRMYDEGLAVASVRLVARNRRRYGGYIVHFGVVLLFCAFAGLMFKTDVTALLKTGETVTAKDPYGHEWTFTSQGLSSFEQLNRRVLSVTFDVTKDGKPMGLLSSEKRQHVNTQGEPTFEPSTEVGILESMQQDVYLVFTGAADRETAAVHIHFNPLVWWVWFGGIIMAFGGLIVMWPQAQRAERESGYVAQIPMGRDTEVAGAGA